MRWTLQVATGGVPWAGVFDIEVIESVKAGHRPKLMEGADWHAAVPNPALVTLIKESWAQDHEMRPPFVKLTESLDSLNLQLAEALAESGEVGQTAELTRALGEQAAELGRLTRTLEEEQQRIDEYETALQAEQEAQSLKDSELETLRQELAATKEALETEVHVVDVRNRIFLTRDSGCEILQTHGGCLRGLKRRRTSDVVTFFRSWCSPGGPTLV